MANVRRIGDRTRKGDKIGVLSPEEKDMMKDEGTNYRNR